MITTSATYNTIFADPSHYAESKIVVGNTTYDESVIMSLERSQSLYADYFDIGGCIMNQIQFTLLGVTADQLPKMSRVEVWTRIKNSSLTSEWLPMGVYYTAKPDYDTEAQLLSVTGYDEMYKANVVPFAQGSQVTSWANPTIRQVAQHLADGTAVTDVIDSNFGGVGIALEDPTQISDAIIMPSIPYNFTAREILGEIAVACCGNWIVVFSDSGSGQVAKLRLVTMDAMQGTVQHDLGRNITGFTKGDPILAVTDARVYYGYDGNGVALYESAVATPNDGRKYDIELKTFTDSTQAQAIAQNILSGLGTSLPPYTADGTEINPACELGDIVLVNGVTSSIGGITTVFNQAMWADISSPSIPTDDEFGYESGVIRAVNRAERTSEVNKAQIAVNADSIQAEVTRATGAESDMNESLRSTITQTASDVTISLQTYAQDQVNNHAEEQQRYIRYSSSGLELGQSGSMAMARLTPTALEFQNSAGATKAYIGQDPNDGNAYKFFVINGHIVNQLELGDHWLLVASGSDNDNRLTFKWRA